MNVNEALISRRSVRRFLPDSVTKEKIDNILKGAAFAPSGHNIQPWHVYVVEGQKKTKHHSINLKFYKRWFSQRYEN